MQINEIFDDYVGGNSDNWRKVWTIYTFPVRYEEYFVKKVILKTFFPRLLVKAEMISWFYQKKKDLY